MFHDCHIIASFVKIAIKVFDSYTANYVSFQYNVMLNTVHC